MKKTIERRSDMRPEYNFASMKGGIRGKHYEEYRKGTNIGLPPKPGVVLGRKGFPKDMRPTLTLVLPCHEQIRPT
jgi:hypothetical protein